MLSARSMLCHSALLLSLLETAVARTEDEEKFGIDGINFGDWVSCPVARCCDLPEDNDVHHVGRGQHEFRKEHNTNEACRKVDCHKWNANTAVSEKVEVFGWLAKEFRWSSNLGGRQAVRFAAIPKGTRVQILRFRDEWSWADQGFSPKYSEAWVHVNGVTFRMPIVDLEVSASDTPTSASDKRILEHDYYTFVNPFASHLGDRHLEEKQKQHAVKTLGKNIKDEAGFLERKETVKLQGGPQPPAPPAEPVLTPAEPVLTFAQRAARLLTFMQTQR